LYFIELWKMYHTVYQQTENNGRVCQIDGASKVGRILLKTLALELSLFVVCFSVIFVLLSSFVYCHWTIARFCWFCCCSHVLSISHFREFVFFFATPGFPFNWLSKFCHPPPTLAHLPPVHLLDFLPVSPSMHSHSLCTAKKYSKNIVVLGLIGLYWYIILKTRKSMLLSNPSSIFPKKICICYLIFAQCLQVVSTKAKSLAWPGLATNILSKQTRLHHIPPEVHITRS